MMWLYLVAFLGGLSVGYLVAIVQLQTREDRMAKSIPDEAADFLQHEHSWLYSDAGRWCQVCWLMDRDR